MTKKKELYEIEVKFHNSDYPFELKDTVSWQQHYSRSVPAIHNFYQNKYEKLLASENANLYALVGVTRIN